MIWKDERTGSRLEERPTSGFFVLCAMDFVIRQEGFTLSIRHVLHHQGKGFVPTCSFSNESSANGEFVLGQDQQAYDEAIRAGEELLAKKIEEHKAGVERLRNS